MARDWACEHSADPMIWFTYHPRTPEQRLWATVLEQAARDWWDKSFAVARAARNWVLYSGMREGGYLWACTMVEIDPGLLLAAIERKDKELFNGALGQKVYVAANEKEIKRRRGEKRVA